MVYVDWSTIGEQFHKGLEISINDSMNRITHPFSAGRHVPSKLDNLGHNLVS